MSSDEEDEELLEEEDDDLDDASQFSGHTSIRTFDSTRESKVRVRHKPYQQITDVRLVQEIITAPKTKVATYNFPMTSDAQSEIGSVDSRSKDSTSSADLPLGIITCLKFSRGGRFLAVAGTDGLVKIWSFESDHNATADGSPSSESTESPSSTKDFLSKNPDRVMRGHTLPIMDISWSSNDFIASCSLDCSVRLWHPSLAECLGVFNHNSPVFAVAFHPFDDRIFVSGDSRLRLWSTEERKVVNWVQIPRAKGQASNFQANFQAKEKDTFLSIAEGQSHITAVGFSKDGSMVIAGTADGELFFYEMIGLQYNTQVEIMPSRSRISKGPKVIGISALSSSKVGDCILVTTNDSTLRLFNLRDKSLVRKYRGPHIKGALVKATISEDTNFIVCGSESRRAFIINTDPLHIPQNSLSTKKSFNFSEGDKTSRISKMRKQFGSASTLGTGDSSKQSDSSRLPVKSGVFSNLIGWNQENSRKTQYETFLAAPDAVVSATFAPEALTAAWSKHRRKAQSATTPDGQLASYPCYFVISTLSGSISVFEASIKRQKAKERESSAQKPTLTVESPLDLVENGVEPKDLNAHSSLADLSIQTKDIFMSKAGRMSAKEKAVLFLSPQVWRAGIYETAFEFTFEPKRLKQGTTPSADAFDVATDFNVARNKSQPKEETRRSMDDSSSGTPSSEKPSEISTKKAAGFLKAIRTKMSRGVTVGPFAKPAFLTQEAFKKNIQIPISGRESVKTNSPHSRDASLDVSNADFISCSKCSDNRFQIYRDGRLKCFGCGLIQSMTP
ncbi:hypothetical protein HDU97_002543 [Phlyctochytrium planicorne]|nr:hypothetical protein HDU97_002543 [Phlyctochytrium planicorne]